MNELLNSFTADHFFQLLTTLVLALVILRVYGGRGRGLNRGDVAEISALIIVVACVQMASLGKSVPDFLIGAFAAVVTAFIVNASNEQKVAKSAKVEVPAAPSSVLRPPSSPESSAEGFASLRLLSVCSVCSVVAFLLIGCATKNGGDIADVRAALKSASALVPDSAVSDPKARAALATIRKLSGQDAPAPQQTGELVSDGFFDFAGVPLENGVRRVKTFRAVEEISAPAPRLPAAPPAAELSAPLSSASSSGTGGALHLPPPVQVRNSSTTEPQGTAQAPATGGTSSVMATLLSSGLGDKSVAATVAIVRDFRANIAVAKCEGAAASLFEGATAVVEFSAEQAAGRGLSVSGHVLSISNCPLATGRDLSGLVFSGVPATASGEMVNAFSAPGAEIQFEAFLTGSNLSANVIPTAGSFASALFQRLEITGSAELIATRTVTNAVEPGRPAPDAPELLKSARWNPFPRVAFDAPEIESRTAVGRKNIIGQLFLNGRKVEWIAKGRQWSTIENALERFDKDGNPNGYFQDLKSGDVVTISIADLDGRNESNRKELVVP